jgi:hypothetical protein
MAELLEGAKYMRMYMFFPAAVTCHGKRDRPSADHLEKLAVAGSAFCR